MKITVNGDSREIDTLTLAGALDALGYGEQKVATALNETFIPSARREATELSEGDRLEILSPRQGG